MVGLELESAVVNTCLGEMTPCPRRESWLEVVDRKLRGRVQQPMRSEDPRRAPELPDEKSPEKERRSGQG